MGMSSMRAFWRFGVSKLLNKELSQNKY